MNRIRISFHNTTLVLGVMLLLHTIGPLGAQNTAMEVDGDLTVNKTASVNENLKINPASAPGTPNFISGSNGDAYIKDQLEVDGNTNMAGTLDVKGNLIVDSSVLSVNATYNTVGIGTAAGSYDKLTISGGGIALSEQASVPWDEEDLAKFYAKEVNGRAEMFVMDGYSQYTQISSHADPKLFNPGADSSFSDLSVVLPFSFHHGNKYIGKGTVVDLAGLVAEVERHYGKSFTTVYDLPPEETETLQSRQTRLELRAKERILAETPEVEISIKEAWEDAEIKEPIVKTHLITRYRYDLTREQVIPFQVEENVTELASTGRYERRLKEGVRFDESTGKFYRQRTLDEIQLPPDAVPPLPQWILSRVPQRGK